MKSPFQQPRPTLLIAALAAAAAGVMAQGTAHSEEAAVDGLVMDEAAQTELDVQPEALDANALTDDHSVNVPTGWWSYTGVTPDQIGTYINQNGARLTELELHSISGGVPRFTVRMVKNSGAYAVPGWWWYYGLTAPQVSSFLNANSGRLIDVEPYDAGGGQIRFAVVMVSNTGGAARAWSYLMGVSSAQISSHISNSGHRMTDIDSYTEGGVKKYTAVFVANTGTDAKGWQWWLNQTSASIASKVSAFNGRIVKLERQANGTYNFIQVKNTGSDASAWWYQYGFSSITDLINYGNQVASRPIDITTYLDSGGNRRYDAVYIDNANTSTRRMRSLLGKTFLDANGNPTRGIFESYLKQVNGAVKVDLNSSRRAETASSLKSLHLLHSMRQVQLGLDTLPSAFTYYEYDASVGGNACPDPSKETLANRRTNYNFEKGLDEMMKISDNRTTRGTVIRYGGFTPFNTTATNSGLKGTTLRHNIGCAYWNFSTGKYDPANRRNDTTAADLARIYEGVWNSTLLTNTNSARTEFLESANPGSGAGSALQTIINEEAAKLGKSAVASQFGSLIRSWGKGGSYGTCLPNASGGCGTQVIIRSGTGLIRLPVYVSGIQTYRDYAFARLISDTPVSCWGCSDETAYINAYSKGANELYRDEIREALKTW